MLAKKIGVILSVFLTTAPLTVLARGGGGGGSGSSIDVGISIMSPNQSDVNDWIDSIGVTGTKNVSTGYEFLADYEYRISSTMFAMLFRPSYFMQSASGGGVEAKLTGLTVFPMFRLYPLENGFIKFFMQVGLGYGQLKTELSNNGASGTFDGSTFGAIGGLGAQFCFTDSHCMVIEGNLRYLPIERNTGSASGTLGGHITQPGTGGGNGELELSGKDLGTTMSGIQGVIGYKLNF